MTRVNLSKRASLLKPSPTLAMAGKAKQMKADGIDVVSFAAGEPDFETPRKVVEAAKAALDAGKTRYSPTPGSLDTWISPPRSRAISRLIERPSPVPP